MSSSIVASALQNDLSSFVATAGVILFYLVVWGLVFAGTGLFVGAFIPFITGDSLLFAAGLVTGVTPELNIWLLAIGTGIAAFIGDQVGFVMGRHFGRPYLDKRSGRRMRAIIDRVDSFYRHYGWWSVVVARFVPWARVFIPWVAGIGRMNYYGFLTSNFVGAVLWGIGLTVTGYFAASIPSVRTVAYVIAGVVIVLSIIFSVRAWILDRRDKASKLAAAEA
jgi:membrane-associated protein